MVALSGGADSAVAAWLATSRSSEVRAVFVDHGWPGSAAMVAAARAVAGRTGDPAPRGAGAAHRHRDRRPGGAVGGLAAGGGGGSGGDRPPRRRRSRDGAGQPASGCRCHRALRHPGGAAAVRAAAAGGPGRRRAPGRGGPRPPLRRRPGQRRPRASPQRHPPCRPPRVGGRRPRGDRRPGTFGVDARVRRRPCSIGSPPPLPSVPRPVRSWCRLPCWPPCRTRSPPESPAGRSVSPTLRTLARPPTSPR